MAQTSNLLWVIIAMAAVTYIPRMLPMVGLSGKKLPDWLHEWLGYIPVTVLAALLFPILFLKDNVLSVTNIYLWTALPTFVVAFLSKNIFATIITGMIAIVTIRILFLS